MAQPLPQITVGAEAEAVYARAEVQSVPAPVSFIRSQPQKKKSEAAIRPDDENKPKDYFVEKDGLRYAGSHLILDMWNAENLDNVEIVERALKDAVTAAGATLLHIHVHQFSGEGGISGVAVLAESHISVHTWPERGYAAFDIFMCGEAKPALAIPALKAAFRPDWVSVGEHKRGIF
ncbi:MAG: adenosylmethionine decarboxylase [Alphaproteobacteria bacterium]|nr:adenosylmethionine decarboxylase [Alphaproteobacteria bacterium]